MGSLRHGWLTFHSRFLMWSFECVSCDSGLVPRLLNSYNMPVECVSGEIDGFIVGVYCSLNLR